LQVRNWPFLPPETLIWINAVSDGARDSHKCLQPAVVMIIFDKDYKSFERNPLDVIEHDHMLQLQLCDAMEQIADGLPDEVDRRLCSQVSAALQYDLPLHHKDEEDGLFPLLLARKEEAAGIEEILGRLTEEHRSDTAFAGEVAELLETLSRDGWTNNPDMAGYMLRGFFEGYRRHISWEQALVIPVARRCLAAEDLAILAQRMARHRAATVQPFLSTRVP
jgi:hemerythrin-like domain-containing protein